MSELEKQMRAVLDEPMSVENADAMITDLTSYVVTRLMPIVKDNMLKTMREADYDPVKFAEAVDKL